MILAEQFLQLGNWILTSSCHSSWMSCILATPATTLFLRCLATSSLWSDLSNWRHFILARNLRNLSLSCGHGEALVHELVIVEAPAGCWKYLTSSINCSTARRTRSWSNSLMTFHYKRNSEKSLLVSLNYGNTSEQPMQFQHRQPKEVLIAGRTSVV